MPVDHIRTGPARQYVDLIRNLPVPEQIDWDDAPTQFKVYRGRRRIPLDRDDLGQLLHDCYGVTRYRWTDADALRRLIGTRGAEPAGGARLARNCLRPVPSGGSRFPAELYVLAGPDTAVPPGLYHYDAPHHSLVTIRDGDWTGSLAASLGCPGTAPRLTLLTSVFFWKNGFKYGDLTYRLAALDAGVLIGQILTVASRQHPAASVRYQFVDDDMDRLLRLDPMRESVYAAVVLDPGPSLSPAPALIADDSVETSRTGAPASTEGQWSLDDRPVQAALHRAARITSAAELRPPPPGAEPVTAGDRVDLLAGLRRRSSSMGYFTPAAMTAGTLLRLLGPALDGYPSDIGDPGPIRHTSLYCAVNRVAGLEPGVYRFGPDGPIPVRAADLGAELQESLLIKLFNLAHTNLCVYPVGDYERGFAEYGDRWYRIQNLEAGIVTQRLYLAAAALGLSCHASLGYEIPRTDTMLGLDGTGATSLIQLMIGAGRPPGDYYEVSWQ
ncbi:MAG TPA: SagB family peptide dehydrogenase [Actinoplanes sp.]|nr:SagB family peptide dehydrogenase [Actinoplanes sp.]